MHAISNPSVLRVILISLRLPLASLSLRLCCRHYLSVVRGQAANGQAEGQADASWAAALPPDIDALFAGAARLATALAAHGPSGQPPDTCRWPLAACHNDLVGGYLSGGSLIAFGLRALGSLRCFALLTCGV
jgi:hypothetical protein